MTQSVGEKTGVNSTLGIAPKTEDFVKQVATSDMFEIQSSKIAQERGNADQKAGTIVKDHQQSSADQAFSMLAYVWRRARDPETSAACPGQL